MTSQPTSHIPTGQTDTQPAGTLSSPVVAALEATWAAIQDRHPEIPDVVIVLASGSIGLPKGVLRLGHFAAMRWHRAGAGSRLPEVFVGGEGLERGATAVLGTLLHEATHALAHVREIRECSRQGRYHNRRFQVLADELGLDVRQVPVIGWSETHVPDTTAAAYAVQVDQLAAALTIHRYAEGALPASGDGDNDADGDDDGTEQGAGGGRASSNNGVVCRCECGRRIRVAPTVLERGAILCGCCTSAFHPATGTPG